LKDLLDEREKIERETEDALTAVTAVQSEMNGRYPSALKGRSIELAAMTETLAGARRKLVERLLAIVPLMPIVDDSHDEMKILNVLLPLSGEYQSMIADTSPVVAAGMGLITQLLCAVSAYIDVPLLYPMTPRGARSTVSFQGSELPLFGTKLTDDYKRAIVLLNSNVRHLCFMQGLALEDPHRVLMHLWNLSVDPQLGSERPSFRVSRSGLVGSQSLDQQVDEWVRI
jgi:hypothetical protein